METVGKGGQKGTRWDGQRARTESCVERVSGVQRDCVASINVQGAFICTLGSREVTRWREEGDVGTRSETYDEENISALNVG